MSIEHLIKAHQDSAKLRTEILKEIAWNLEDINGLIKAKKEASYIYKKSLQIGAETLGRNILRLTENYFNTENAL